MGVLMGVLKKDAGGATRTAWNIELEELVLQYETPLLRYATGILHNGHTAQDVVQNAFIKLCRQWRQGAHPTKALKSWLYKVTHNEAIDYMRRETRLKVLHEKHAETKTDADCPDGLHCPAEAKDTYANVIRHVRTLSDSEQQVILLRLQEGLTYDEIANVIGRSRGNVGCILHHAVKKLAKRIQKERESENQ